MEANTPSTIMMIRNPVVRASLTNQYSKIIDRAKFDLTNILITASATLRQDSQRELDGFMAELWLEEHRLSESDRLLTSMLQLIEQRQTNIADCIKTIYEHRFEFLRYMPIVIMREFPQL